MPEHPDHLDHDLSIVDTLAYLKDSGTEFLKAKAELAAIESKEALAAGAQKAVLYLAFAFFAFFTYTLLLITIIGAISTWLEGKLEGIEKHIGTWPIVTIGLFFFHLLLVVILLDKIKAKGKVSFFTQTKAELKKDQLWLQQMTQNKEN